MDQKRFITAMLLSGLVLIVWQMFFVPDFTPPPVDDVPVERVEDVKPDKVAKVEPDKDQVAFAPTEDPEEIAAKRPQIPERTDVMTSGNIRIELTNRAASVTSILITDPEQYEKRGDLLDAFPEDAAHYPFSIAFTDNNIVLPEDPMFEVVETESVRAKGDGYSKITYRYTDPRDRYVIDKVFRVNPDLAFVIDLDVKITNNLTDVRLIDTLAIDIFGHQDLEKESNFLDFRPDELEGVCRLIDDTERKIFQKIEGPLSFGQSAVMWGAIDTRYFLLAAIPQERGVRCTMEILNEDYLRTRLIADGFSVAPGQTHTISHLLFLGPKDFGALQDVGHRLEESIDYGILTILARPLRWLLALFYGWVGNWGLAIILLTLLIKGVTWPITDKAYVNAERMKAIQPKLKEVKEKYKSDQQRMTEETMKLFKENNVSPLGCLPMLIQMPVLYALFVMIYTSVELYQAEFALWYIDLSAPDPFFVLPILMGAVMVVQQRWMTPDTGNPQMAMMMKVMPVMFTAFMLFLPSGLVLYYFVNLLLGLLQQYLIKRKFRTNEEAVAA